MKLLGGAVRSFRMQPRYYLFGALGVLVCMFGWLFGRTLVPTFVAILVSGVCFLLLDMEKYEVLFAFLFVVVVYLGYWFVGLPVARFFIEWGNRLLDYGERFKYSYARIHGEDFPKPHPWQFRVSDKEVLAYKRRFCISEDLDYIVFLGTFMGSLFLHLKWVEVVFGESVLAAIVLAIIAGIAAHVIIQLLNDFLARRYSQYEKAEQYLEAEHIYDEVHKEMQKKEIREKAKDMVKRRRSC